MEKDIFEYTIPEGFEAEIKDGKVIVKKVESKGEKIRKWLIAYLENRVLNTGILEEKDNCKEAVAWLEKQGKCNTYNSIWHKVEPGDYVLEKTLICKKNGEIDLVKDTILSVTDAEYALPISSLGIPKSLEKQKEHKPLVIPKFRKGDFIRYKTNPDDVERVDCVRDDHYILDIKDKCTHVLFTCQDLWELVEQNPIDKVEPKFKVGDTIQPKDPVLGEPRIIERIHPKWGYDTNKGILDFEFEDNWELVEQNPAWNEEDEEIFEEVCSSIKYAEKHRITCSEKLAKLQLDWFKLLKDRVQPQPKQEWSEEDEKMLHNIIKDVMILHNSKTIDGLKCKVNWLKSLKERIKGE